MLDKFMITEDSFGPVLPSNWQEIAEYLNSLLEDAWDKAGIDSRFPSCDDLRDFRETTEEIWAQYWNGMFSDAPEAIFEEEV